MRAAVFEDVKTIRVHEDYPKPEPAPDESLVKVHYCAICGSDLTNFKNKLYQVPLVMGHEFSGTVEEVGGELGGFSRGDKVVGINVLSEEGYGDVSGLGIFRDGGFAEYVTVPQKDLFHVPDSISLLDASMIESFSVAYRAIHWVDLNDHARIAIIGGGNIGLTTLSVLLDHSNLEYVIVVEPHEFLRKKALELGANDVFPPSKVKIKRYFKKRGAASLMFECAGNKAALMSAISLVERGGTIIIESIHQGNVALPVFLINNKEISLKGTISHNREDVLNTIALFEQKALDPGKLISEVIPLGDIQAAFERFLKPEGRKFIKLVVKI